MMLFMPVENRNTIQTKNNYLYNRVFHKMLIAILCLVLLQVMKLPVYAQSPGWQQKAEYHIEVKLDTASNTLEAFMLMHYYNNSPDTLKVIWMHLMPNAFKTDRTAFSEQSLQLESTEFYFSEDKDRGYIHRMNFQSEGEPLKVTDDSLHIDIIQLTLNKPLPPGGVVSITTPFRVKLPKLFSRLGVIKTEYAIAHWYPVPAMYDQEGWHPMPYLSIGEFYAPFASWHVRISVPENMKVAATGVLQTQQELEKLKDKNTIRLQEVPFNKAPYDSSEVKYKTLYYTQDSVHSFAWFASTDYEVDYDTLQLPSGKIIDLFAFYYPWSGSAWKKAIAFTKDALLYRSEVLGEYPYATATVVAASDDGSGGMEYPTITRLGSGGSEKLLDFVIEHELGHNWFYGILATNERKFPLMDEGMNTYYDFRYLKKKYGNTNLLLNTVAGKLIKKLPEDENAFLLQSLASVHLDQPMNLPAEEYSIINYSAIVYNKTGKWMEGLEKILGKEKFDMAMKEYYETWKFHHPYPEDFKNIIVKYGGKEAETHFELLSQTGPLEVAEKRTLKPAFLFNFENTNNTQYINFMPLPGYNQYDKIMAGMLIHNYAPPLSGFRFAVLPQYAFGSKKLNFTGTAGYHYYTKGSFRKIETGLSFATYSTGAATDAHNKKIFSSFHKIAPYIKLDFKREATSRKEMWLQGKVFLIKENSFVYKMRDSDSTYHPSVGEAVNRYVNELKFYTANHRLLYPWSIELKLHQSENFYRTDANFLYFFNYRKSGGLQLRLFASKFGNFSNVSSFETLRFQPKLTGVRGWEDYTYSNYFIGRNEFSGFASRQLMNRDGGLKLRTDIFQGLQGRSSDWLASINISTSLPEKLFPVRLPLYLFFDAGTYAEAWDKDYTGPRFLYTAGLKLSLWKDMIEIYAPVLMSREFSDNMNTVEETGGFGKRISFSIDIYKFNFRKLTKGML